MDTENSTESAEDAIGFAGQESGHQLFAVSPQAVPFLRVVPGQHLAVTIVILCELPLPAVSQCFLSAKFLLHHPQELLPCLSGAQGMSTSGGNPVVGMMPVNHGGL